MNGDTNDKYQLPFYCDATSIYEFKKLILISWDIKEMAGGLTSVVKIILTKGCRLVFMSSPNADMIAVSLCMSQGSKKPI